MRIIRFFAGGGAVHLGVRDGEEVLDLGLHSPIDLMHKNSLAARRIPAAGLRLDAPIRDCRKLLCLAGNYRKHVVESGFADVEGNVTPQFFWKPPTAVNAPGGEIRLRPNNVFLDWEIELAVVIGPGQGVFGYTIVNDISERKFNANVTGRKLREFDPFFDWLAGKWFDGSAPMGPEIVTADEIPDPHNLRIRLWLNGELMQDSNTGCMLTRVPEAIQYISEVLTLEPGDVIAMGTPEGVGMARGIKLKPGDRLRGEIEKIGVLETWIR